jgi:hypothetical protein
MCYKNNTPMLNGLRPAAVGATIAIAVSTLVGQTSADSTPSPARAAEFLQRLKEAVDSTDRRTVSTMVAYPLTVLASGFNIPIKDSASFIRLYDSFMTPELRCAVVESAIPLGGTPAPRRPAVMTPDGLSLVEGAVWAPFKDGRYRIARIRVLPKASSVEGRKSVERVTFAQPKGERSAAYTGWLVRQNVDAFLVAIKKGETLSASVEGFRGHDGTIRVTAARGAADAAKTPRPVPDAGRTASASAVSDGEYFVEVAHAAHYCDPPQRYKLTVTVR